MDISKEHFQRNFNRLVKDVMDIIEAVNPTNTVFHAKIKSRLYDFATDTKNENEARFNGKNPINK